MSKGERISNMEPRPPKKWVEHQNSTEDYRNGVEEVNRLPGKSSDPMLLRSAGAARAKPQTSRKPEANAGARRKAGLGEKGRSNPSAGARRR
jgi:hypothetical protein